MRGLWFFSWIEPIWASDSYHKTKFNSGSNSRRYSNLKVVLRGIRPRGTKNRFSDRGRFKHGSYMPWVVYFMHADNFWKVSFEREWQSLKTFLSGSAGSYFASGAWCPAEQNPAGFQTSQNKNLRGIRPHGTKSCGVSDPAEQWQSWVHFIADTCSERSDTLQNNILRALIPRVKKSFRVSNPAEQSPEGYQTPWNNISKWIFL